MRPLPQVLDRAPATERQRLCWHEAAHAVVAAELGFDVHMVFVVDDRRGRCNASIPAMTTIPKRVAYYSAGWIAERDLLGQTPAPSPEDDAAIAAELRGALRYEQQKMLHEGRAVARRIIRIRAVQIERLAGALDKHGLLQGARLRSLLNEWPSGTA